MYVYIYINMYMYMYMYVYIYICMYIYMGNISISFQIISYNSGIIIKYPYLGYSSFWRVVPLPPFCRTLNRVVTGLFQLVWGKITALKYLNTYERKFYLQERKISVFPYMVKMDTNHSAIKTFPKYKYSWSNMQPIFWKSSTPEQT